MNFNEDIETKLLRVNSKYKLRGSNTNFQFQCPDDIFTEQVVGISLIRFNCPRLFPNVYSPLNVLEFQDGSTIIVPEGQYNATELAAAITAASTEGITVSYDETTKRMTFTGTGVLLMKSPMAPLIGVTDDLILSGDTQTSTQLSGPDPIYVESSTIALNNMLDHPENGGNIPGIDVIPTNYIPYGFNVSWRNNETSQNIVQYTKAISIKQIDIQLTDQYGNIVSLPENCYCDLVFKLYLAKSVL